MAVIELYQPKLKFCTKVWFSTPDIVIVFSITSGVILLLMFELIIPDPANIIPIMIDAVFKR